MSAIGYFVPPSENNPNTYAVGGLGLRKAVPAISSFVVFALYERKNDKHMIGTYHAAAGENAALCCGMQQLRKS